MKTYRIIIVENDEDEQFFMKEGFDAAGGFQIVAQLKSGDDLFEWLNENKNNLPDVILSDLNMPGKNGYDIIQEQKNAWWSKVPVIITSTSSTKSIMDRCLAQGAAAYIVKPETFVQYVPYVNGLYKQMEEKNFAG